MTQVRTHQNTFSRMMKGYIALSRVQKAHDLFLPSAFSPALFRQGPQPWPTLLMTCLHGEVDDKRLLDMTEEAAQRARKSTKLTDLDWTCGQCAGTFKYMGFLVKGKHVEEEWFKAYWEKIIAPGHGRLCIHCKGEGQEKTFQCAQCEATKPKVAFSDSMWKHRHDKTQQGGVCIQCQGENEEETFKCAKCKETKPKVAFSDSMWKNRHHKTQQGGLCIQCQSENQEETCKCAICKTPQPKTAFPESMWNHRHQEDRTLRCLNCSRPPCTAQQCKTCTVCRDPECKRRKCTNPIVPLNSKLLPKDAEEVERYLCRNCQYITCKCGNRMSQTMQKKTKGQQPKKEYVCVDCQTKDMHAKDRKHTVRKFR